MMLRTRALFVFAVIGVPGSIVGCGADTPDDAEAREVVTRFIEQIRTGKVDDAWASTTSDFKSDEGRDSFRKYVKDRPVLRKPLEIAELKEVEIHGLKRWEATLRPAADAKAPPATVRTMIARESDIWKVERIVVEQAGPQAAAKK